MDTRDVMTRDVVTLTPEMSLQEAADVLLRYRIHGAPVVDAAGMLVGMVSVIDLVGRVGKTGLATGVHLHYGLKRNGAYVNPVIEHRNMPPGEPVASSLMTVFASERDRYFQLLFTPGQLRAAN